VVIASADELKLVFPQEGLDPARFVAGTYKHFVLQPLDGGDRKESTRAALAYCLGHPQWRLGLQLHKILDIR